MHETLEILARDDPLSCEDYDNRKGLLDKSG
jgi:hypothetical protein